VIFCKLIAGLFVILSQLNLTKLEHEFLKSDFQSKMKHKTRFSHHSSLLLKYGFKPWNLRIIIRILKIEMVSASSVK